MSFESDELQWDEKNLPDTLRILLGLSTSVAFPSFFELDTGTKLAEGQDREGSLWVLKASFVSPPSSLCLLAFMYISFYGDPIGPFCSVVLGRHQNSP